MYKKIPTKLDKNLLPPPRTAERSKIFYPQAAETRVRSFRVASRKKWDHIDSSGSSGRGLGDVADLSEPCEEEAVVPPTPPGPCGHSAILKPCNRYLNGGHCPLFWVQYFSLEIRLNALISGEFNAEGTRRLVDEESRWWFKTSAGHCRKYRSLWSTPPALPLTYPDQRVRTKIPTLAGSQRRGVGRRVTLQRNGSWPLVA